MRRRVLIWIGLLVLSLTLVTMPWSGSPMPAAEAARQPPYQGRSLPDLSLEVLEIPAAAEPSGFTAQVRASCRGCDSEVTTSISLRIGGFELPRVPVTFRPEPGSGPQVTLAWETGPLPAGAALQVVATIDPGGWVEERDEQNNSLSAQAEILTAPYDNAELGHWGSRLID